MQSLDNSAFAKEVRRAAQAPAPFPPLSASKPTPSADKLALIHAALQQLQSIQEEDSGPSQEVLLEDGGSSDGTEEIKYVYDASTLKFYKLMDGGDWVPLSRNDVANHLSREGYCKYPPKGVELSAADEFIVDMQSNHYVSFAGELAGYKKGLLKMGSLRILITGEPTFVQPVPGPWDLLKGILEKMFGEQLPYVYGWLKVSLGMFLAQSWSAGQVLALCGERNSGKTLFTAIVQCLFGGREPGKPFDYMTGQTSFNSDLLEHELLTIDDEVSAFGYSARMALAAKIKQLSVVRWQRLHAKGAKAITVIPLQRLIICLNDSTERLKVLPPIEDDIVDKIMLLRVHKHPMPMPTGTAEKDAAFMKALMAEVPAFAAFLQDWEIPVNLSVSRLGIKHYHHPDLLEALQVQTPEAQVLQLIDLIIFAIGKPQNPWSGPAHDLLRQLRETKDQHLQKELMGLVHNSYTCGKYLGRLASECPERVSKRPGGGGVLRFTIVPPSYEPDCEAVEADSAPPAASEPLAKNAKLEVLRQKMVERQALKAVEVASKA